MKQERMRRPRGRRSGKGDEYVCSRCIYFNPDYGRAAIADTSFPVMLCRFAFCKIFRAIEAIEVEATPAPHSTRRGIPWHATQKY